MTTRQHLHHLIDELPDEAVRAVELFMEFVLARERFDVTDPVLRTFLDAPEDDEAATAEDVAAIAEARASFASDAGMFWNDYMGRNQPGR